VNLAEEVGVNKLVVDSDNVNVAVLKKYSHRLMRGPLAVEIKKVPTASFEELSFVAV
jgi:hypothetical protein